MFENTARFVKSWEPAENPLRELSQQFWCSGCDEWVDVSVKPGAKVGAFLVPDWAFCCGCGSWLPDADLGEAS